jgi:hypothetical protein
MLNHTGRKSSEWTPFLLAKEIPGLKISFINKHMNVCANTKVVNLRFSQICIKTTKLAVFISHTGVLYWQKAMICVTKKFRLWIWMKPKWIIHRSLEAVWSTVNEGSQQNSATIRLSALNFKSITIPGTPLNIQKMGVYRELIINVCL